MTTSAPRVEYMDLAAIVRAPRNPKAHDLAALGASLDRFGFVAPLLVNERTGRLVAGGGRLDALQQRKAAGGPAPARIRVEGDAWLVPVLRGVSFETDADAEAYLIADNRLSEVGGWDDAGLAAMLADLAAQDGLAGTGYDQDDIDDLLRGLAPEETVEDDPGPLLEQAEVLQRKWNTARGQTWVIGAHRLRCGDATSAEEVAALMGDERAGLMNTDPPYGVDYGNIANSRRRGNAKRTGDAAGVTDYSRRPSEQMQNDEVDGPRLQAFLEAVIRTAVPVLCPNPAFYLWHPMLTQGTFFAAAAAAADILIHRQIIWVKPSLIMGRGDYHWRHELCFYGWIRGRRCVWLRGRDQDTVWEMGRERDGAHPTQKPVALFAQPILNHLRPGELAYEPMAGSGSQFVAAQQLGRRCYGLEIEPRYVAVVLERLAGMGLTPTLA